MKNYTGYPYATGEEGYSTYDLGASAAMILLKHELIALDRSNPRKVKFIFKDDETIADDVNKYLLNGLTVKAREYFDTIKALKNRMFSD